MTIVGRLTLVLSTAALLVGCAVLRQAQDDASPIAGPGAIPQGTRRTTSCPCVYATNSNDSVTVYAIGANGNVKPIQEIRGSNTGLSHPHDVAVDASGNIYVVNIAPASVSVYAAGATGNAAPIETIAGSNTRLALPLGIAVNQRNGEIYVANVTGRSEQRGSVTIYSPGSNGNVVPLGIIEGSKTQLRHPNCVALDANGNIFVTNASGSVAFYAAGSGGNVAPTRIVEGDLTGLKDPTQVTVDSSLNTYVANAREDSVTVYSANADGNVAPIQEIHGRRTNLFVPLGVAVDTAGTIYVASRGARRSTITVYAAGSDGNVRPIQTITGKRTGLVYPHGIAIH